MKPLIAAFLALAIAAEVSAQQLTDQQRTEQQVRNANRKITIGWWGAVERRRALQPQTAIGIGLGKAKTFRIMQTW